MYQVEFHGNKPSLAMVTKAVKLGIKTGTDEITIFWGENSIELEKSPRFNFDGLWFGRGWIKNISGHDIAETL
jgi:hypothetical protein